MLIFYRRLSVLLLYFSGASLFWPCTTVFLLAYFLSNSSSFYTSVLYSAQRWCLTDSVSLFIVLLLFLIMFIAFLVSLEFGSYKLMTFVFMSLSFVCYQVFTTGHLFWLYFFYEASLIPILYIIIKWGSYPERSLRAIIILVYTLVFGAPVLILIVYINQVYGCWGISYMSLSDSSFLFSLFVFLCFSVKLPIYGLHFWLPMAHVEAPTFGSVILARVLLKLGGVGLMRLSDLIRTFALKTVTLSYFMVFIIFSSLVCCYQSDIKRLIAYSSVAHMIVIPFLVMSNNILANQALILVMFLHGLSSTLLFITVGTLYTMFSSRQLVLMRGLILTSPLFRMLIIFTFLFTLSAPPFPSYVAEVFFIYSSYMLSPDMLYVILLFAFLGLVYNLNWLSRVLFSTSLNIVFVDSFLKFNQFYTTALSFLSILPLLFIFFLLWWRSRLDVFFNKKVSVISESLWFTHSLVYIFFYCYLIQSSSLSLCSLLQFHSLSYF